MKEGQAKSVLVWAYNSEGRKIHRTHFGPYFSVRCQFRYSVDDLDDQVMHIGNFLSVEDVLRCCRDDVRTSIKESMKDLPNIGKKELVESFGQYGFDYNVECQGIITSLEINTDELYREELDRILKTRGS